jgi:hypothetical protein
MSPRGDGGTIFDVWCGFRHFLLSALKTGFRYACGCNLPDNVMLRNVFQAVKARLGLSPEVLCEWMCHKITDIIIIMPACIYYSVTAVHSFWCGINRQSQAQVGILRNGPGPRVAGRVI